MRPDDQAQMEDDIRLLEEMDMSFDGMGTLFYHHMPDACRGDHCCLHNPSDHHMKTWRLVFRYDRPPLMERMCQHGVGHPDPDCITYLRRVDPHDQGAWSIHGCDGCCHG